MLATARAGSAAAGVGVQQAATTAQADNAARTVRVRERIAPAQRATTPRREGGGWVLTPAS